jgi:hypothetical protein
MSGVPPWLGAAADAKVTPFTLISTNAAAVRKLLGASKANG